MIDFNGLTDDERRTLHKAECILLDLATRLQAGGHKELVYKDFKDDYTDESKYKLGTICGLARALYEVEKAKGAV